MTEKITVEDGSPNESLDADAIDVDATLVSTSERRLMAKVDLHVVPVLTIMYLLAFLDRVNIGNARIFGLEDDLGLTGTQFNTSLTIFFVPYVLFEIPSNILLKKLRPHVWLSLCMFFFGLITLLQGFVQNFGGLMATRFLLGVCETGMFPGCFYLMGMWYKRSEAQKRFSFFFSSATLAGAFGGLLASAIGKMHGMRGYLGWRWVFILEGLLTCVVSFVWFFLIADFPEDVKWLNEEERAFIRAKLAKDVGKAGHSASVTFKDVIDVLKDPKIILGGLMYFGQIVPGYGYAYFAPTIIRTYGYEPIPTQLHSIPPWVAAFGFCMLFAYLSDRLRHRFAFAVIATCVSIAGFGILLSVHGPENLNVQYGALFLVTMGNYSAMPLIICWFTMNLSGHKRRSIGSAFQIGFGNIGGIISTYSFIKSDKPKYTKGFGISVGFICLSVVMCCIYLALISYRNKSRGKKATSASASADAALAISAEQQYEDDMLGDLSPKYRYQY